MGTRRFKAEPARKFLVTSIVVGPNSFKRERAHRMRGQDSIPAAGVKLLLERRGALVIELRVPENENVSGRTKQITQYHPGKKH